MEKEGYSKQSEENLVKKTCRELGITQKELAEMMGYSPQIVSRWNRGEKMSKNAEMLLKTTIELSKHKKAISELSEIKDKLDKLISVSL